MPAPITPPTARSNPGNLRVPPQCRHTVPTTGGNAFAVPPDLGPAHRQLFRNPCPPGFRCRPRRDRPERMS